MTSGTEIVAARLRQTTTHASQIETLLDLYTDPVTILHTPRTRTDGPWAKKDISALAHLEEKALQTALSTTKLKQLDVSKSGDKVRYVVAWDGTRPDGSTVEIGLSVEFTVRDGKIAEQVLQSSPEQVTVYGEVLRSGGFTADRVFAALREAGVSGDKLAAWEMRSAEQA